METTTEHKITYVDTVTREYDAEVDADGDIDITDVEPGILDVLESTLYCSVCGRLMRNEYEAHGISEYWEVS